MAVDRVRLDISDDEEEEAKLDDDDPEEELELTDEDRTNHVPSDVR